MTAPARQCASAGRPGFTTVELLVAMTVSLILLAGGVSVFYVFQESITRQRAVHDSQTQIHLSVEQLVRLVRNADEIDPASTSNSLGISGGLTFATCGNQTCWIEADANGRLVARPPVSGAGQQLTIASALDSVKISYGIFDANGKLSTFAPQVPSGSADDVLAVSLQLFFRTREGRSQASGALKVHVARRDKILDRLSL